MSPFPTSATVVRYRVSPQLKIFTVLFFMFVGGAYFFAWSVLDRNAFIALGVLCVLLVLIHVQQFGYRIAYDDKSLFFRRWGIWNGLNIRPQTTEIAWQEVTSVKSTVRGIFGRNGDFLPLEMLEVKSRKPGGRRIPIYPWAMNSEDFEALAAFMSERGKLPV